MEVCVFTDEVSPDFDRALELSRAAGADSVEIRGGLYGRDVTTVSTDEIFRIREALARHGLRVASIGSPFGKCFHDRPDELADHQRIFARMIELGSALDCRLIRGFGFWNPNRDDPLRRACLPAYLDGVVAGLAPAVRMAESAGFMLGIELAAETFVATSAEVALIVEAFNNSGAVRVVWDIDAEWSAGEAPYPTGYQRIKNRIVHVHIKPNRQGNMLTVKDSEISCGEILVALNQDGYTGAVSIEHWGSSEKMLDGVGQLRAAMSALGQ